MTTTDESTGIIEQPKKLDTLLKSTTYQGMSDEEIKRIIDYWKETCYESGRIDERNSSVTAALNNLLAQNKELAAQAEAAFNNAVMSTVKFEEV